MRTRIQSATFVAGATGVAVLALVGFLSGYGLGWIDGYEYQNYKSPVLGSPVAESWLPDDERAS
jgi:hypothetical protein